MLYRSLLVGEDDDTYGEEELVISYNDNVADDDSYLDDEFERYTDDALADNGDKNIDLIQSTWGPLTGPMEYIQQKTRDLLDLYHRYHNPKTYVPSSKMQIDNNDVTRKLDKYEGETKLKARQSLEALNRMKKKSINPLDTVTLKRDSEKRWKKYVEEHTFSLSKSKNVNTISAAQITRYISDMIESKGLSTSREPLIPLEAPQPQGEDEGLGIPNFDEDEFAVELKFKFDQVLTVQVGCSYFGDDNVAIPCTSTNFTELEVDSCILNVTYTYSLVNNGARRLRVFRLLDENFQDIIDQSVILRPNIARNIVLPGEIDLCLFTEVDKKVIAMASRNVGAGIQSLPFSRDEISFTTP